MDCYSYTKEEVGVKWEGGHILLIHITWLVIIKTLESVQGKGDWLWSSFLQITIQVLFLVYDNNNILQKWSLIVWQLDMLMQYIEQESWKVTKFKWRAFVAQKWNGFNIKGRASGVSWCWAEYSLGWACNGSQGH